MLYMIFGLRILLFITIAFAQSLIQGDAPIPDAPIVRTKYGQHGGKSLPSYDQSVFLGIPYAQPPVGSLRFRRPLSLNTSWAGVKDATEYGKTCYQGNDRTDMSEDCLTLNIIRPTAIDPLKPLPVFVCIYGGGFTSGSSSDAMYNLTHLVHLSQNLSQPIIGVSLNYRLDVWGFLSTPSQISDKETNAGLLDQRMALQWIQENIKSFGGDPKRVTLWGMSAGAQSIALHLHSYGGRDEGLFQAAILESGGPIGTALQELPFYKEPFEELVRANRCADVDDRLGCLRRVPAEEFARSKPKALWNPIIDGNFLTDFPSALSAKGQFIKVPLIVGANTDEGSSFSSKTVQTDADLSTWLSTWRSYSLSTSSIQSLSKIYENYRYPPYAVSDNSQTFGLGAKWRKSGAIGGDIVIIASRRKLARQYTSTGQRVWSYRFDTPSWNAKPFDGIKHAVEVVFSLQNNTGMLGPVPAFDRYQDLSEGIGRAYVGFVNGWDPNGEGLGEKGKHLGALPRWPSYAEGGGGRNMVLNANGSFVERDDWREEGIAFICRIARELLA